MVAFHEDGSIRSAGAMDEAMLSSDDIEQAVKEEVPESKEAVIPNSEKPEEKKVAAKLIKDEEKSEGRISRRALFSFFR